MAQAHTTTSAPHLLSASFLSLCTDYHHLPAEACPRIRPLSQIAVRLPGVEPGAHSWEACRRRYAASALAHGMFLDLLA
jgi:hypothetical protein